MQVSIWASYTRHLLPRAPTQIIGREFNPVCVRACVFSSRLPHSGVGHLFGALHKCFCIIVARRACRSGSSLLHSRRFSLFLAFSFFALLHECTWYTQPCNAGARKMSRTTARAPYLTDSSSHFLQCCAKRRALSHVSHQVGASVGRKKELCIYVSGVMK